MTPSKLAEYAILGAVFLVIAALLVGNLLGQPILLSYVETGSMSPTLEPGDGFVAVPKAIAGPVEPGDVVVFDAENLHQGGLVTHRVLYETDQGYVTKGDANPTTDQDSVEPPVQDAQIVAKALQVGDTLVVIPKIGLVVILINELLTAFQQRLAALFGTRALLGSQGLAYLLFAIGAFSYLWSELRASGTGRQRRRAVSRRARQSTSGLLILAVLTIFTVAMVTASMTVPGGTQEFGVVSSTVDGPGAGIVPAGESESFVYRVPSHGIVPVVVFLEPASDGIDVSPRELYVPSSSVRESIVEVHAPSETGYYRRYMVERRYLAVLPRNTIGTLYGVHPWLPIVVIDLLITVGYLGVGVPLVTGSQRRIRSRNVSIVERFRRLLE